MRALVFVASLAFAAACGMGSLWLFCTAVEWLADHLSDWMVGLLDYWIRQGLIGLAVLACGCFGLVAVKR